MPIHFTLYRISTSLGLFPILPLLLFFGCARKNFYAETQVVNPAVYQQLQEAPDAIDSVTVQAGSHYRRGSLYNALWGKRHRNAWLAPVTVPVLRLDTVKGGLEVEKIGGGMQTISATMVGGDGMTYVLRTVDKRPEVKLPVLLRKTFLSDIVLDQTSALHPYGDLVVAYLARAAKIPQPNPVLVYVRPNETRLGEHKELLSDRLYMLEEKYNDKRALVGELAKAYDIVGTEKMLDQRYGSSKHAIDQLAYAKARLLDLLIGDRDRHEGQWEWAAYVKDGEHIYRPIPKDRDNAFYIYDGGIFSWLLSRKWTFRKYVSFSGKYRDVKALAIKAAYLDARAMPEVTSQQFDSLAHDLQRSLTDEVIEQAVRELPKAVYLEQGESLAHKLKSRKDDLDKAARKLYKVLAEEVLVIGTADEEQFEVVQLNKDETEVTVRRKADGKVTFHRIFHRSETDEIILHGLADNDSLIERGQVRNGIEVSIIKAPVREKTQNKSQAKGRGKKLAADDMEQ